MVVQNFLMALPTRAGSNLIHHIAQCQFKVVGFALAQHFSEIGLGVYIQQKDFLALQHKASAEVIHRSAFPDAALLVGYGYHLCLSHRFYLLFL